MTARLLVEQAGPLSSIQDTGRFGYRRFGVTASGPVDRFAFLAGQAALGLAGDAAAIELSLGGITLRCVEGEVGFAVTGGDFMADVDGVSIGSWCTGMLRPGNRVRVRDGAHGNWGYLSLAGDVCAPDWLGSRATHQLSGLGGGMVRAEQTLMIAEPRPSPARSLPRPPDGAPITAALLVLGPQDHFFTPAAIAALQSEPFSASARFDRMGLVLDGPPLVPTALDMVSEGATFGAIQVDGAGTGTLLLADHQTTGGYPRVATVIRRDAERIAQLRAGQAVRFSAIDADAAVQRLRRQQQADAAYFASLAPDHRSLAERLLDANLIDGIVDARD